MTVYLRAIALAWLSISSSAAQADLIEGMRAYHAKDYVTAFDSFREGAKEGDPASQYYLAGLYADGLGVQRDDAHAAIWLYRAAKQGDASAQYRLGSFYTQGRGVLQDYDEAKHWLTRAAKQADSGAQFSLGYK